mmetsp:Transcript_80693/g.248869  ORF Transcript_80693/g.248869 Transcript_80693/m.248869 type:complete len:195 (+) Transcript_80693:102-686(+)
MGRDSRPRSCEQSRRSRERRRSPSPRGRDRDRRRSPSPRDVRERRRSPSPRERGRSASPRDARRPPSRSRSRSDWHKSRGKEEGDKDNGKADGEGGGGAPGEGEAVTEIVDGVPRVNGDLTWQAQIYVPRPGVVYRPGQKPVKLCIRGPSRPSKEDAQDDAKKLESAFKDGGIKEVRRLRSILNNDAGRGGWGM